MQLRINSLVEFLYAMLSPAMKSLLLEVLGNGSQQRAAVWSGTALLLSPSLIPS